MTIAQGQQGRPCFAFLFEENEEKAQERRRIQCAPLALSFINKTSPKETSLALLLRGAGAF
jgi:predicted ArsR family transcriptional regulator